MSVLRAEQHKYPTGAEYLAVYIDDTRVGLLDHRDGGYVPSGGRKPIACLREAMREVVRRRVRRMLKEVAFLSSALESGATVAAVDPEVPLTTTS